MDTLLNKFNSIKTFVFDVDGVLTDGTLTLLPGGIMARRMNVKDGYALQLAVKKGYNVIVISGGFSDEVVDRLKRLGIENVFMKVTDKLKVLTQLMQEKGLNWDSLIFMGDDIPDLEVMKKAGLACCPADAVQEIKEVSAYISHANGGFGCVRDVIEKVMKLRKDWNENTHIPSA
jgi:3-deoxy-D-manno-octulosonate 8-phosphate phosphatase (KDO 8-P phosphatase)